MASAACLRAGAGLVYAAVPDAIYVPVASAMTEAMVLPFPSDPEKGCFATESLEGIRKKAETCDVLILGPGLGRSDSCQALTEDLLKTFPGKIILDADGLYAFSRMNLSAEDFASKEIVVTPHHGEFMRIAHSDGITDPVRNASDFAVGSGMITVLKGPDTVIAFPDGRIQSFYSDSLSDTPMAELAEKAGGICRSVFAGAGSHQRRVYSWDRRRFGGRGAGRVQHAADGYHY